MSAGAVGATLAAAAVDVAELELEAEDAGPAGGP